MSFAVDMDHQIMKVAVIRVRIVIGSIVFIFRLWVGWGIVGGNIKYTHSVERNAVSIL